MDTPRTCCWVGCGWIESTLPSTCASGCVHVLGGVLCCPLISLGSCANAVWTAARGWWRNTTRETALMCMCVGVCTGVTASRVMIETGGQQIAASVHDSARSANPIAFV